MVNSWVHQDVTGTGSIGASITLILVFPSGASVDITIDGVTLNWPVANTTSIVLDNSPHVSYNVLSGSMRILRRIY